MLNHPMNKDPFIYIEDNVLDNDFCKHVINKFENDSRPAWGTTFGGVELQIKKSKDLHISNESDWKEEDNVIGEVVGAKINEYNAHLNKSIPLTSRTTNELLPISFVQFHHGEQCTDSGYQIQKTEPGDGYVWHNDFAVQQPFGIRVLTFIFYLNTVDEGWTQFYNGFQVEPKEGRLLIFPSTFTYIHQGYPPKQDKYIVTGWIHESMEKIYN